MGAINSLDFTTMPRPARLLAVIGSDRQPEATAAGRVRLGGISDLHKLLGDDAPCEQLNLSRQLAASRQLLKHGAPDFSKYRCVINLVTDPDQHPRTLDTLRKLLRGYRGRVINRPEAVMRTTRDQVARRLTGIPGLHVPRTVRLRNSKSGLAAVEKAGIAFPAILRRAGTHGGDIVGVVANMDAMRASLNEPGDYVLTEFVDFRGADGLYRKYRFFLFGRRPVLRHMIATDRWDIHARERARFMAERPDLLAEEARLFEHAEGMLPAVVHQVLGAVAERMELDCFGMDCAIAADGRMVLFEANATMNFFPFMPDPRFAYVERCLAPSQVAFRALVNQP